MSSPDTSAQQLRTALRRKLGDIDKRMAGLTALRGELERRLDDEMAACPLAANSQ